MTLNFDSHQNKIVYKHKNITDLLLLTFEKCFKNLYYKKIRFSKE